jgi:hypothetical protein
VPSGSAKNERIGGRIAKKGLRARRLEQAFERCRQRCEREREYSSRTGRMVLYRLGRICLSGEKTERLSRS